jgi:AraC-like DNA-binding protein
MLFCRPMSHSTDAPEEQRVAPRSELSHWVEHIGFVLDTSLTVHHELFPPRAEACLLFRWSETDGAVANAMGPLTRARQRTFRAPSYYVRVVLRAGQARPLFGIPMHEVADAIVPIDELWGEAGRTLRGSLGPTDVPAVIERIQSALLVRLHSVEPVAGSGLLRQAMARVAEGSEVPLANLFSELGVSDRQIRRVFREGLGMSPKRYARITRVRRVLALAGSMPWARLALESGFHDQSHLIREFRELMQVTPSAYRAGREKLRGSSDL